MTLSASWLANTSNRRFVLVKATPTTGAGTATTIWMSSAPFRTTNLDVVALPIVSGGLKFNESISEDGGISISFGDLEVINPNGVYDSWLDISQYVWVNKNITIYYGSPDVVCATAASIDSLASTPDSDLEIIFSGVISQIDSKSIDRLNFILRDKLEILNAPVTEAKLGTYGTWVDGQTNQDTIKPLVFGEVHNYEPLLINPAFLEYMFNNGAAEELIEIRDNGTPIYNASTAYSGGATVTLSSGTFKLTRPPAGTITVSAKGVKNSINLSNGTATSTFDNNIARIIALIATQYGKSPKLSASDVTSSAYQNFATANTQAVGVLISDRTNVIEVCRQLADSIGAQIFLDRVGKLQIVKFGVADSNIAASTEINTTHMLEKSFKIARRLRVVGSVKLNYCKNWTVQSDLQTAILPAHKDLFSQEWLSITVTDSSVMSTYALTADPIPKDTLLIRDSNGETTAEANRLLAYYKVQKTVYSFTGTSSLLSLKLGQPVTLKHPRYGLSSGVSGQVVSLSPNWLKNTVDVEVVI